MHARRAVRSVVFALLLTGCTATGAVSPTGTPTANLPALEETAAPAAATTLQFSGSDVRALDATGDAVSTVTFDAGVAAVVELVTVTAGIDPATSEELDEGCAGPHTSYQWDGIVVTAWTGSTDFVVGLTAPALGSIRLETTGEFAPGDDVSAFSASAPAENVGDMGGDNTLVAFDVVGTTTNGEYTSPIGAVGYAPDGMTLQSVATPGEWSSFLC